MLDHSSEKLARRSLLTSALTTVFFSNVKITDPSLNILGLEILLAQENIVAFGKLTTLFLCIIFVILILPKFSDRIGDFQIRLISRKLTSEIDGLMHDFGMHDSYPPTSNNELIQQLQNHLADRKNEVISRKETILAWLALATHILVELSLPILVSWVAIFHAEWAIILN